MIDKRSMVLGAGAAVALRGLAPHLVLLKLRRDVRRLNDGDYGPVLSGFAENAVLRFNEGPHRWSGEHRGKPAIERFLKNFTAAGMRGEVSQVWVAGPPWALTLAVRFDDRAIAPDGEELYANRVAITVRTKWGRIVEQDDFYADTTRIAAFEEKLRRLGVEPAAA
jgi:ketosteroid isomerase-like protein